MPKLTTANDDQEQQLDWPNVIEQAKLGDRESLGKLFDSVLSYLLLIANSNLNGPLKQKMGASDVVQKSLLEANEKMATFKGGSERELKAWLKSIVIHNLLDGARRYRKTKARSIDREHAYDAPAFAMVPSTDPTPSWYLRKREEDESLLRHIEALPPRQRQVLIARHRFGKPYSEIADEMETSVDAVRKMWSRAISQLKASLAND